MYSLKVLLTCVMLSACKCIKNQRTCISGLVSADFSRSTKLSNRQIYVFTVTKYVQAVSAAFLDTYCLFHVEASGKRKLRQWQIGT